MEYWYSSFNLAGPTSYIEFWSQPNLRKMAKHMEKLMLN